MTRLPFVDLSTGMSIAVLKRQQEAVRAAKLALLKIEAQRTIDRTDASALAHVASAITDELIIPAMSRVANDMRQSESE